MTPNKKKKDNTHDHDLQKCGGDHAAKVSAFAPPPYFAATCGYHSTTRSLLLFNGGQ
jgi:hypothetical protein